MVMDCEKVRNTEKVDVSCLVSGREGAKPGSYSNLNKGVVKSCDNCEVCSSVI